ncbi:MAG: DNA repair protein RecO, partial [Paramuribaculum sp.]|nr:DNA repair protein RecO [Paramuribaculum sp.]
GIHSHPVRSAIALFVAEVLGCVLRDGPPDSMLWRFIADGIAVLDRLPPSRLANFHICFLSRLASVIGIFPDIGSYSDGMVFDMADGRFRMTPPLHPHFFSAAESRAVPMLGRLNYRTMHLWRLSRDQRQSILDGILEYYSIHYASLTGLKSLEVLRSLM